MTVLNRMIHGRQVVAGAVALLVAGRAAASGGPLGGQVCTTIGCANEAAVVLTDVTSRFADGLPLTATVCFQSRCAQARIDQGPAYPACEMMSPSPGSGEPFALCIPQPPATVRIGHPLGDGSGLRDGMSYHVSVRVVDRTGRVRVEGGRDITLTARSPNGPRCGPVCYSGGAEF